MPNKTTDKELISKYTSNSYNQKNKQPNQKVGKTPNRHFFKDIQMANKPRKRCSTSLIIREMEIKTTMRYHLKQVRLVRLALIKKSTNNKCWKGCGEKEHSCTVGGNVN